MSTTENQDNLISVAGTTEEVSSSPNPANGAIEPEHLESQEQTVGESSESDVKLDMQAETHETHEKTGSTVVPVTVVKDNTSDSSGGGGENTEPVPKSETKTEENNERVHVKIKDDPNSLFGRLPVKAVEKPPSYNMVLAIVSVFINPVFGALAVWQSCKTLFLHHTKSTERILRWGMPV